MFSSHKSFTEQVEENFVNDVLEAHCCEKLDNKKESLKLNFLWLFLRRVEYFSAENCSSLC